MSESLRAFAAVFANADLRRVELAWGGSVVGQWGYEVALAVFAYRAGGATAVGLVALVRLLPAALVAPFAALLGDRFRRRRIMVAADLARVCALNALAAVASVTGGLAAVVRAVKLVGFVASAPSFTQQPQVVNGASELLLDVFGDAGKHARSAVGVAALPLDAPVEVELVVEVA